MEFPGVSKKQHVDFQAVTKKKLRGISRGLGFWYWNFDTILHNFHWDGILICLEFPGVK